MANPHKLERTISRRMFLLAGIQAAAGFSLIGRLYYLQFVKSEEYRTMADGNRIKIQLIAPKRGDLLDRIGVPLAENEINYRLFIERENRAQARQSLKRALRLISLPEKQRDALQKVIDAPLDRKPLLVKDHLSWSEVARIEFHMPDLPGSYIEQGQMRYYPLIDKASHLIGHVGRVSESEMTKDNPVFRLPEFKIGKSGCELLFEQQVRGIAGAKQIEVNATGLSVRELKVQPSQKGEDIHLSIDAELQRFAAERMGVESGAVVVMDAHYGEVLTLVSMPAFDPNTFSVGISNEYWKELNANEKNPLLNKAITGLYPPGSTFKMMVGLAGLKSGAITPNTQFFCPGHYFLGNHRFNCWRPEGHGSMNLERALAESCDTFFYNVAYHCGIEPIVEACHSCGLGHKSELGLNGEKDGLVPSPQWKLGRYNAKWTTGDTINVSIGQGFVLASPLQLAMMIARIVNGGRMVQPTLRSGGNNDKEWPLMDVDPSHLEMVMKGMEMVMNHPRGTAYWTRIVEEGMTMGGKTGTSQVRRITQRGVNQLTLPWSHRHHALFVGYAPIENPRFVCSVVVEHGGGGSSAAAPVAHDVLLKLQQLAADNPQRYRG